MTIDVTPQIFGVRWDTPDAFMAVKVDTPVGDLCLDCNEPIEPSDRGYMMPVLDRIEHLTDIDTGRKWSTIATQRRPIHLECYLRGTMSHAYEQCDCFVPGRSLRAEALATLEAINADRESEGTGPL